MKASSSSLVDSFLFTNVMALRIATKVSISIWGGFLISVLLGFEHPIWAMITGMISFFGGEHAQVMKKCIFQCVSTLVGGVLGLLIMSCATQSPLLGGLILTVVVLVGAGISAASRDLNITFCCAIFVITVNLIVMIPVTLTPTTQTLLDIFIDRVGAVVAGAAWSGVVSIGLWPAFSGHVLRAHVKRLQSLAEALTRESEGDGTALRHDLVALHQCVVDIDDNASHSQFEGPWGRRAAGLAREAVHLALGMGRDALALHRLRAAADGIARRDEAVVLRESLASQLNRITEVEHRLGRAERSGGERTRPARHWPLRDMGVTGVRSALLFLIVFFFWSVTGWQYGFLITIVPLVISIMFSRFPSPRMMTRKALVGALASMPVALVVFVLLAGAPSAVELILVTAGPVMFVGLMGLSSPVTFPYSLGFCLCFMVFLLPQNVPVVDLVFAIERTLAVPVGLVILLVLFSLIPPVVADPTQNAHARMRKVGLDVSP